ncbi:MAG: regulator [Acidobacteria bacterium]|nr:regulator [Acidobacteriota bacterium]
MKRLLFIVILLVTATVLAAEKPPLITRWENFTTANGIPDDKVFCLAVDGPRVWAGTEDGLVLIENGKVARVYGTGDGLVHRVVMGIAVDKRNGDLWIGTFGGLSQFSGGQFKNYTNLTSGLLNDIIYGVAVQDYWVWVATTAGISRLDTSTGEWRNWSEFNAPFHEPWSYGIAPAPEIGKVYFAVWGGGMIEYDIATDTMKPYTDPDEEMELVLFRNQGLVHIIVSNVAFNPDTKMTWGSTYFGLTGYDGRNWHNYLTKDSGLASDFINAPKSRGNEVWACTDKGLSFLDYKTNTWVTYRRNKQNGHGEIEITWPDQKKTTLEAPTSLAHNYILNMEFQGKDIWVATAKGLSHGIREPQMEAQLYGNAKLDRRSTRGRQGEGAKVSKDGFPKSGQRPAGSQ